MRLKATRQGVSGVVKGRRKAPSRRAGLPTPNRVLPGHVLELRKAIAVEQMQAAGATFGWRDGDQAIDYWLERLEHPVCSCGDAA
jgi:hypothetical protein